MTDQVCTLISERSAYQVPHEWTDKAAIQHKIRSNEIVKLALKLILSLALTFLCVGISYWSGMNFECPIQLLHPHLTSTVLFVIGSGFCLFFGCELRDKFHDGSLEYFYADRNRIHVKQDTEEKKFLAHLPLPVAHIIDTFCQKGRLWVTNKMRPLDDACAMQTFTKHAKSFKDLTALLCSQEPSILAVLDTQNATLFVRAESAYWVIGEPYPSSIKCWTQTKYLFQKRDPADLKWHQLESKAESPYFACGHICIADIFDAFKQELEHVPLKA